MVLTDNSIFIETPLFSSIEKKNFDDCLDNIFKLSYSRLTDKIEVFSAVQEIELQINTNSNSFGPCQNLSGIYDKMINKLYVNSNKNKNKNKNFEKDLSDKSNNFSSLFDLNIKALSLHALIETCASINKDKVMFQMNNLNNIIKNSKFDEIFKVEKITSIVDATPNQYLSTPKMVLTFALFGFIFGVLLVYNLKSPKKINE